ncbi:MAG: hypothetical protein BAJALOKI1v1_1970003 [Promethearchaeota archaeon]|nr:MAG: hypothetical protein BAJALOKI1v1_1970003 [Candidatus Lokiarchaeota archaeon]
MEEFYYPPLDTPRFIFDYTHQEGFYIDPRNQWQITMNLVNTPLFSNEEDFIKYYQAITSHEISHYQIIPYDGYINAKLLKAAMNYVNQNYAPIVVNIFADLVIDRISYLKNPDLISWELRETYKNLINKGQLSSFSQLLFSLYEQVLNIEIFDEKPSEVDDRLVKQISTTILQDFYNEEIWEQKVQKIAYYLLNILKNTFTFIGAGVKCGEGYSKRKAPGKGEQYIKVPDDVLELMDNPLENRNSDKLQKDNKEELQQKSEEFAKDTNYSEFGAPAQQAGILVDGDPLSIWYRGKAKNLIEIKIYEKKPGGEVPVYPEVWRIGDPIEELDVSLTLLNSPIIIPNITTRKWKYELGEGHLEEQDIPDLLIVLDSSGSMSWNYLAASEDARGPYHTALIAAFASLHYAAKKGVKFSVINFSDRADICPWTYDYRKAEKTLLRYQGGGTELPIKAITTQCNRADKNVLVFVITDFGIYNWSSSKKTLLSLSQKGHKLVGFFIGSDSIPKKRFKDLLTHIIFYAIKDWHQLINLVIEEITKYY